MKINIRGENLEITEAINEYAIEKVEKISKFLNNTDHATANVLLKIEKDGQVAEITVRIGKLVLRAEEKQESVYAAIDVAVDKIERQIRKNKTKLQDHNKKQSLAEAIKLEQIKDLEEDEEDEKKIVKRKKIELIPMSDEEAILNMELISHDFYLYKDQETMRLKIVYKRNDGNYGTIEEDV